MARKPSKKRRVLRASFDDILEKAAGIIGEFFDLQDWYLEKYTTERAEKRVSFTFVLDDAIEVTAQLGKWINDYLRGVFTPHFRKRTFINLRTYVQHDKGASNAEWRTLSSTLTPKPAFTQAEHNASAWVVRGSYDACDAMQFIFAYVKEEYARKRPSRRKKGKAKAKRKR